MLKPHPGRVYQSAFSLFACAGLWTAACAPVVAAGFDLMSTTPSHSVVVATSTPIRVGGHAIIAAPTSSITPAQSQALQQVLTNSTQSLLSAATGATNAASANASPITPLMNSALALPQAATLMAITGGSAISVTTFTATSASYVVSNYVSAPPSALTASPSVSNLAAVTPAAVMNAATTYGAANVSTPVANTALNVESVAPALAINPLDYTVLNPVLVRKDNQEICTESKSDVVIAATDLIQPVAFIEPPLKLNDEVLNPANSVLASSDHDLHFKLGTTSLYLARGAATFVIAKGEQIAILVLHEKKAGDVRVTLRDGHQVVLRSGEAFRSSSSILPKLSVRGEHKVGGVLVCEYSIPSAVSYIPAIAAMRSSKDAFHRSIFNKMMKDAAVMQTISMHRGAYKSAR